MKTTTILAAALACALAAGSSAVAQEKTSIESRLGTLEFQGGYPTEKTTDLLHDQVDFSFATTIVYWAEPFIESATYFEGVKKDLGVENNTAVIFDQLVQPGQEMPLTPNQSVIYLSSIIDVSKEPIVVEIAPNTLCLVMDMWQRGTEDPGTIGPDKGKGGKYLVLPPGYDKPVPHGYFVIRAHGNLNTLFERSYVTPAFTKEQATQHLLENTRIYPLSQAVARPALKFTKVGQKPLRGNRPQGLAWWSLLKKYIDLEVVDPRDRSMMGLLAGLGMQKDKPFNPDERLAKTLVEAERVGTSMVENTSWNFRPERIGKKEYKWPGHSHWKLIFYFDGIQENPTYTPVFERAHFYWQAYGQQKFWKPEEVVLGKSTLAVVGSRDGENQYLNGSNSYHLHVPADVPVKNFWALTVYDIKTRGVLENKNGRFEISSASGQYKKNPDGSVDLYVAPEKPDGVPEANWIQSVKGKGFFAYFRFYGVLESFVDGSWKLGDFEKVK